MPFNFILEYQRELSTRAEIFESIVFGRILDVPPNASIAEYMECGGKRSATPLWIQQDGTSQRKRRRRSALPAHSIRWYIQDALITDYSLCLLLAIAPSPPIIH